MKERSYAPMVVVLLIIVLIAYVGSYFALVTPNRPIMARGTGEWKGWEWDARVNYRAMNGVLSSFYWPLEQIDRRIRPDAWPVQ